MLKTFMAIASANTNTVIVIDGSNKAQNFPIQQLQTYYAHSARDVTHLNYPSEVWTQNVPHSEIWGDQRQGSAFKRRGVHLVFPGSFSVLRRGERIREIPKIDRM
jgi:hypothetical protein